jgi:Flp pilus assembly protein TadD
VSDAPVICSNCGAKFAGGRSRCPRCRAVLDLPDPGAAERRSQRLLLVSALLILAFGAGLFFLWQSGRAPSAGAPPASGPAPSASLEPAFLEWTETVGRSPEELKTAVEQHRAAASANPDDAEALGNLGRGQLELGNAAEAVTSFRAAVNAAPQSSEYRFQLARAQCALARWDDCITSLRAADQLAPDTLAIVHNIGVALQRRGVDDVAMIEFKRAQALSETEPAVRLGLATSYDRLGRSREAVEAYKEFLRLEQLGPQVEAVRARISVLGGS